MARPLLDVTVLHAREVPGAQDGGADRLTLVHADDGVRSPEVPVAAAVIRAARIPVRVMLRLRESHTTTGGEFVRLIGLAQEYLALGAEGVVFGFLDEDLEVDLETCSALSAALPGVPWTFHRAFDATLDPRRSWRRVLALPGLTAVCSGGSPQGLGQGYDDLLEHAGSAEVAAVLMPSGQLRPDQVPWLMRAGVSQFHLEEQVRPGGTIRSYVDADFVRSWRLLLDGGATSGARPA